MVVKIDLKNEELNNLDGKILVAMPSTKDERFNRAVVYMCTHTKDGSMGIVVNRLAESITFGQLVGQLDISENGEQIRVPERVGKLPVHLGGPLQTERGFVLHSKDYISKKFTIPIDGSISLTTTLEIVKDIVHGRGPLNSLFALGYAGWGPGQLETEIQANGWLVFDSNEQIIFNEDMDATYDLALRENGIEPAMLSSFGGQA